MTMTASNWTAATRANPCPICGGPDNCKSVENDDGATFVYCGRVPGSIRTNAGGQHLHIIDNGAKPFRPQYVPRRPPASEQPQAPAQPPKLSRDFTALSRYYSSCLTPELSTKLASKLNVSQSSLVAIGAGYDIVKRLFTFPEKNHLGSIVGISLRRLTGKKKWQVKGGNRGLTYASDWQQDNGPIHVPEGASDAAALKTMQLSCISRPSAFSNVYGLAEMLAPISERRQIVIIGERDHKKHDELRPNARRSHNPDCTDCRLCFPGKHGAMTTAKRLANILDRPIDVAFPPSGKDSRAWLATIPKHERSEAGQRFVEGLKTHTFYPSEAAPVFEPEGEQETVELWRESLLQVRLESLSAAGYYSDASITGAGKSSVDIRVFDVLLTTGPADSFAVQAL